MAEKEVENARLRFGDLDDVLQLYYKQQESIIEAGDKETVLKVVQEIVVDVFRACHSDIKLGPVVFRESIFDADILEAYVPLVIPDVESTVLLEPFCQGIVTLRVNKNSPQKGWVRNGLLVTGACSIDGQEEETRNVAGSQPEETCENVLLSTRSLQQSFENLVQQRVSKYLSKEASDLTLSSIRPGDREHFFIGLELTGKQIHELTKPPHRVKLRLIPVIEMISGTVLLTSFNSSPYPSSLPESESDLPPRETLFTYSLMARELEKLEEDDDSALNCLRTLCSLRETNQLSSPLIYSYHLLNCVLLVHARKGADGESLWSQLSDGERFVEVMKLLVEYFLLSRLSWHFDSNTKLTLDMADDNEVERLRLVQYITQVFITRKFKWLIPVESSTTGIQFPLEDV